MEVENDFNDWSSEKEIPGNLFSPAVDLMDIITEIVEEDSRIVEQAHSQPLDCSPAVDVMNMMAEIVQDDSRMVTQAHSQPLDCSPAVDVMDIIAEIGEEGCRSVKQAHSQLLNSAVMCIPMMMKPSRREIMHSYDASLKATGFPAPKRRRR